MECIGPCLPHCSNCKYSIIYLIIGIIIGLLLDYVKTFLFLIIKRKLKIIKESYFLK